MIYISIPSKTFLIGEYAVLRGAKAILINTQPCFWFAIQSNSRLGQSLLHPFCQALRFCLPQDVQNSPAAQIKQWLPLKAHPQSPAGQWLKRYPEIEKVYHIRVYDPHQGKGGFGFSSAQFSLVYVLGYVLDLYRDKAKGSPVQDVESFLFSLWQAYRGLKFEGLLPSGADVISQWMGKISVFSLKPFQVCSLAWPFKALDFFLVRTGLSLNTHQHIKDLSSIGFKTTSLTHLTDIAKEALWALKTTNQAKFMMALKRYSLCLKERGLLHPKTLKLVQQIGALKEVVLVRGCGAMGAEVVAVFFLKEDRSKVKAFLDKKNSVASSCQLTQGVCFFTGSL